jgi:hypothetical protein
MAAGGAVSIAPATAPGEPPDDLLVLSSPYAVRSADGAAFSGGAVLRLFALGGLGWWDDVAPTTAAVYRWDGADWEPLPSLAQVDHRYASASILGEGIHILMAARSTSVHLPLVLRAY